MYRHSSYRAGGFSPPALTPAVKGILIACVAVYFIQLVAFRAGIPFTRWFGLVPVEAVFGLKVWQVLSYAFLHGGTLHIFFNLLVLYFFGVLLESRWGTRPFLRFYLLAAAMSGLSVVILSFLLPGWLGPPTVLTVGASGALNAMVAAFALIFPELPVYLFFVIPVKGRYLIPIAVVVDLFAALDGSPVSLSAHFGGLLAGWLLVTGNWRPRRLVAWTVRAWRSYRYRRKRRRFTVVPPDRRPPWMQ